MALTNIQTALAGLFLSGLVVAGTTTLVRHNAAEPAAVVQQVAVPAAQVPGYSGPVYDAQGKIVGYSPANGQYARSAVSAKTSALSAPANSGPRSTVSRPRSKKKSAAIVLGSAGAGAAIGGLAGGGKGAGIGAISGGAAGFIYDRMTHKKP